jgi:CubicO group peptidase (beta-lactamase class C family)
VRADTVYDLASVTKSIPTASLALTMITEGVLHLEDKVSRYLPELRSDQGATIEDLLRYRVRGVQLSKLVVRTFEEVRAHALERGFDASPGKSVYTNLPAYILGMVIERVGKASLAELAHREFFEPLAMHSTTFFPSVSDCAPTEIGDRGPDSAPPSSKTTDGHGKTSAGKEVRGLPHDESAYKFALARRSVGHAGLFSTAPDLLHFLEALLTGKYPYITEGASRGFGFQTEGAFLGSHASMGSFGKTGFTGTSICVDREKGIAFVILSNRTYPARPADNAAINAFRALVADSILGA